MMGWLGTESGEGHAFFQNPGKELAEQESSAQALLF